MPRHPNEVLVTLGEIGTDRVAKDVQLLPLGKWSHTSGPIEITPERAASFVRQFEENQAGQDLPVLYIHSSDKHMSNPNYGKAAGWIRSLRADPDAGVLADIEFTEPAAASVAAGEYRYVSAEYFDKIQLPHHEAPQTDVLMGVALVNRPHLKGMRPILNEETGHQFVFNTEDDGQPDPGPEGGGPPMDPILVALCEAAEVTLSDGQTELTEEQNEALSAFLGDQETQLAERDQEITALKGQLEKTNPDGARMRTLSEAGFKDEAKELALARGERLVRELATAVPEGHTLAPVIETELKAFAEDSDPEHLEKAMAKFAAGDGIVDLQEHGGGGNGGSGGGDDTASAELISLAEERAAEKDIQFDVALDEVIEEHPELYDAHETAAPVLASTGGE